MDINRYMVKAKTLRTREWVTGYYYKIAETTHCTSNARECMETGHGECMDCSCFACLCGSDM